MRKIVVTSIIAALIVTVGGFLLNGSGTASGNSRRPTRTATPTRTPTVPAAATSTPAATWTPAATDTPTATPPPVPTPPTIVGNRALIDGSGISPQDSFLVDTSDGSTLATYHRGQVIGNSCDGALMGLSTYPTGSSPAVLVIDTETGVTLASQQLVSGDTAKVTFPCPLKGYPGVFSGGPPAHDRAIVTSIAGPLTILDLTNGQQLFSIGGNPSYGFALTCANDAIIFPVLVGNAITSTIIVRLSDGTTVATLPASYGGVPTC